MTADPRADIGAESVVAGDPFSWDVTISATAEDGTVSPVDLTTFGSAWAAKLRTAPDQEPAVAFTVDDTDAATGVLVLSLSAAQTTTMASSAGTSTNWYFDLQVTGGTVTPFTPYKGQLTVFKVFTHA